VAAAIGVDIGGTFTDIVVLDGRGPRLFKFPSTPTDPAARFGKSRGTLAEGSGYFHPVCRYLVAEGLKPPVGILTGLGSGLKLTTCLQNRSSALPGLGARSRDPGSKGPGDAAA